MTVSRRVGLVVTGVLVIALAGCKSDEAATAAVAPDQAQPVDAAMMMAPAEATGAAPADGIEMKRSEDGSTLEIRKVDPAAAADGAESKPAQPAH